MDASIALDGMTALRVLRAARRGILGPGAARGVGMGAPRTPPYRPDPGIARSRWTRGLLTSLTAGDGWPLVTSWPPSVAVPTRDDRLQLSGVTSSVYGESVGQEAFVTVDDGLQIPCPELLFVEMARVMHPYLLALLGCELCGRYVRDADDPRGGEVRYGVEPVTSVERIGAFVEATGRLSGKIVARRSLRRVHDDAWSPMEAVIATLAGMPVEELGYELAPVTLNGRVAVGEGRAGAATHATRVPDLLLAGTRVGINYDGGHHLDLGKVTHAALSLVGDPGASRGEEALAEATREVRDRYVDDRRRDRELWAHGYRVFSVTREDMEERGGLDRVMALVVGAIEEEAGVSMDDQRGLLASGALSKMRQDLVWAAMPGTRGERAIRRLLAREAALSTRVTTGRATTEGETRPAPTPM